MTRRWSIAWRLAIGLSAGLAIVWLGAVAIAASIMQNALNVSFDEGLRQAAFRLLPLANAVAGPADGDALPGPGNLLPDPDQLGPPPLRNRPPPIGPLGIDEELLTYVVVDRNGDVVLRPSDVPAGDLLVPAPDGFSRNSGRSVFTLTDPRSGSRIIVAERTDHRADAIRSSLASLVWPLVALVPLMGFGILFGVRRAMGPVARLSDDIARRGSRNLAPLDTTGQPAELAPIADAVASLLDRLRAALDAERAFAASSAHELRTPIAGALAQTQLLARELAGAPGTGRIGEIEAALKQLAQLAERLLQLARLDAGFARTDAPADLLPALRLVVRDIQATEAGGNLVYREDAGSGLVAAINLDAFAIAVRNLIHNAVLHGTPGEPVTVVAGPGARVAVANRGAVVPAGLLERLGEPFIRGPTKAGGSGLGLSIVRSIADQTGGRLTLRSPAASGDGFEAVLDWSADAGAEPPPIGGKG